MRFEFNGKSTGVGAYHEAEVWVGSQKTGPDYVARSATGNHRTSVWKDIPEAATVVDFGNDRSGKPFCYFKKANGDIANSINGYEQWVP